jgi:hypothetical protein
MNTLLKYGHAQSPMIATPRLIGPQPNGGGPKVALAKTAAMPANGKVEVVP